MGLSASAGNPQWRSPRRVLPSVYPDPAQQQLREALAARYAQYGVTVDKVVCGAGCDDMIDLLLRMVGPRAVIISTPTFGMYSFLASIIKTKVPRRWRGPGP